MNAAEHIVQSFFWQAVSPKKPEGRHYLTISNVVGGNGSEVDVLAMSPNGRDRLHIESHVDVGWSVDAGYVHYIEEDLIVKKFLKNSHANKLIHDSFFCEQTYRRILVLWESPYGKKGYPVPDVLTDNRIEVWSITDMLQDLLKTVGTHHFQDDILRLMSMLSSMLSMNGALRDCGCKRVSAPTVNEITAMDCLNTVAEVARKCAEESGRATVTGVHVNQALELIKKLGL
ncbi:MAG: hypothetical protein ACYC0V_00570 [Armatimonadota bacterium]